ncbi:MAG: thermonuclease family protein [Candidatus Aminicenantes bacterium]|nr:thermonuclease family protein [Candidatus Aminicenantes bacterium]
MKTTATITLLAVLPAMGIAAAAPRREPARVVRVISADTLTVLYRGKWEELKLIGPEASQTTLNDQAFEQALRSSSSTDEVIRRGLEATAFVRKLVRYGSQIWIEFDVRKRDRYSRLLGYVYLTDGRMLNDIILRQGLAELFLVPPNLRYSLRFQELVRLARRDAQRRRK